VGEREVGPGCPCFVIAEAGVNHNGNVALARRLIDLAVSAGADAVKFQTFKTERLMSPLAPKADYQLKTTNPAESQMEMIGGLELPFDAFRDLHAYCRTKGIVFLSTPFDFESVDFLAELDVPAYKVGSGDLTNLPFLRYVAQQHRPLIVSTGMATLTEVEAAVEAVRETGGSDLVLLHCVSNYPAAPADVNLRAMATMRQVFDLPVGYSDHTLGVAVPFAAVALGACVIEKHVTLDRSLPGPDHKASIEPTELKELVRGIRTIEAALGHGRKEPAPSEAGTAAAARRSLVADCSIRTGTVITERMLALKRPGTGLSPATMSRVIGRTARKDIAKGALVSWDMLQ
jgi:N,N'-diacetyllegionaminate synthase